MTGLEVSRDLAGGGVEKGEGGGSVVGGEIVISKRGGLRASAVRVVGLLDYHLEVRELGEGIQPERRNWRSFTPDSGITSGTWRDGTDSAGRGQFCSAAQLSVILQ